MKRRNFYTRLGAACLGLAALTITSAVFAEELPGKGVTVKPLEQGQTEELFQTYLVGMRLEELGYTVETPNTVQFLPALIAVANGDATYYPIYWNPLHDVYWKKNGGDARAELIGNIIQNCLQGYLIDKKTADQYGIRSLDQLKDPNIAKLSDVDGGGTADLHGCTTGWGYERVIEHGLDAYGLRETVTHKQGVYSQLLGTRSNA